MEKHTSRISNMKMKKENMNNEDKLKNRNEEGYTSRGGTVVHESFVSPLLAHPGDFFPEKSE